MCFSYCSSLVELYNGLKAKCSGRFNFETVIDNWDVCSDVNFISGTILPCDVWYGGFTSHSDVAKKVNKQILSSIRDHRKK